MYRIADWRTINVRRSYAVDSKTCVDGLFSRSSSHLPRSPYVRGRPFPQSAKTYPSQFQLLSFYRSSLPRCDRGRRWTTAGDGPRVAMDHGRRRISEYVTNHYDTSQANNTNAIHCIGRCVRPLALTRSRPPATSRRRPAPPNSRLYWTSADQFTRVASIGTSKAMHRVREFDNTSFRWQQQHQHRHQQSRHHGNRPTIIDRHLAGPITHRLFLLSVTRWVAAALQLILEVKRGRMCLYSCTHCDSVRVAPTRWTPGSMRTEEDNRFVELIEQIKVVRYSSVGGDEFVGFTPEMSIPHARDHRRPRDQLEAHGIKNGFSFYFRAFRSPAFSTNDSGLTSQCRVMHAMHCHTVHFAWCGRGWVIYLFIEPNHASTIVSIYNYKVISDMKTARWVINVRAGGGSDWH